MRGVVALAAAISLPEYLRDGSPFPQRNLIIFLTFSVIFVTLVLQGLTLPPLIRALGLSDANERNPEEEKARREMIEAALAYLEATRENDAAEFEPVYDELIHLQRHRLARLEEQGTPQTPSTIPGTMTAISSSSRQVRAVQRATILNLRNQNQINDETLRKLEYELDLLDAQSSAASAR